MDRVIKCLFFWKKNEISIQDYLISSLIFTISSFVYFLGSVDTVKKDNSFYNVTVLIGNLFYVIGYLYYIYECRKYANNGEHVNNAPYMRRMEIHEHLLPPV